MTATNNAPQKSGKQNAVGMSARIFACLAVFITLILIMLWLLQIVFLDDIYQSIKLHEMENGADLIAENTESDQLHTLVASIAQDKYCCISVYSVENSRARPIASADIQPGCLIHRMGDDYLSKLYFSAVDAGGTYIERINFDGFNQDSADPTRSEDIADSIIYTRFVKNKTGGTLIFLNTEISPVGATVQTITVQLYIISAVLLIGAVILAVYITRKLSAPLAAMNKAAKKLAEGDYDVQFTSQKGSYKECAELSETLNYAAAELSKVDKLQKELISNISHDLRTPLTMISGYSEVMRDIPGEMTAENMQIIIDETQRLSSLVSDLLDVSRYQTGNQILKREIFDMNEVLSSTLSRYMKLTEKDGYTIELDLIEDREILVDADKTRILQVLYNLINNAINYTGESKRVRIEEKIVGGDADARVRINVRDWGDGIEEDKLPLIWDRYYKVDKVHRQAQVGTGLGLSIVRSILMLHNANFGVSSEVGEGSEFWFELPLYHE